MPAGRIRLFVLPPKSPKLSGAANRTHTEEFYEVAGGVWTVAALNVELRRWEHIYNTIRPHQALGHRTSLQFLQDRAIVSLSPSPSHMY